MSNNIVVDKSHPISIVDNYYRNLVSSKCSNSDHANCRGKSMRNLPSKICICKCHEVDAQ